MLYGSHLPPEYNLSNIRTKVHIIYGTNDHLVKSEVSICVKIHIFFRLQIETKTFQGLFTESSIFSVSKFSINNKQIHTFESPKKINSNHVI